MKKLMLFVFSLTVMAASGVSATTFGGASIFDAKQMENAPAVAMANPIQYGGA